MTRDLLLSFAISAALLPLAAPARADIPWPVDGAPVCTAPGDQTGLNSLGGLCFDGLAMSWFSRAATGDTLIPLGSFGVTPPDGGCNSGFTPVATGYVYRKLASARLSSGLVLGIPGCFDPTYPGYTWISRELPAERVMVSVPLWFGHTLTEVRSGDAGTLDPPALAGSGRFGEVDTAVVVVWGDAATGTAQVRAQRVTSRGALEWDGGNGIAVAPAAGPQGGAQVARLADGSTLVVWMDGRGAGVDTYAQHLLPDGSVAPGWPASGLALEDRAETSVYPRLLGGDPYGPLFVVWEEQGPRFGGTGNTSVVARKLLASGLPDPAWSDSGIVVTSSPTVEHLEDAQLDPTGGLVLVWSDTRATSLANPTDLYAQRLGANGTRPPGWPASGLAVCTAPGRQGGARVSVHSEGSTVYAWEDERNGDHRVYATLRNPEGLIPCCNWLADGTPVTQSPGDQRSPVIRAGNAGGAFVAWEDGRDLATNGYDIYGQAFTSDGRNADVEPGPPVEIATLRDPAPNPSRGLTRLRLDLPRGAHVRVDIYDLVGRHVHAVAEGTLDAGLHEWRWAGTDDAGRLLPAGLYHVRARVDGVSSSRTIVRLR